MKSRNLFVVLVLVISLSLCACGNSSDESKKETFKIGMECNYAPFNWTQSTEDNGAYPIESGGYAGGYDVEIAKKLAEGMEKELVIVKTDWDGLTPALTSGKIDAIIAGMSPTADRKLTIDFSNPYYTSKFVMVIDKDGAYKDATKMEDFAGAKISAQQNTFNYQLIDQIEGVDKQQPLETFSALIVALNSGKIDGYIAEVPAADSAIASNPNLTSVDFGENGFNASDEDASVSVGIKKGNTELIEEVNKLLLEITEEERIELMNDAIKNQPLSK